MFSLLLLAFRNERHWVGSQVLILFSEHLFTWLLEGSGCFALFHIPYEKDGVWAAGLIWLIFAPATGGEALHIFFKGWGGIE